MAIQTAQTLSLQKLFILATGSAANGNQMNTFNGLVTAGGQASIDALVDAHIVKMAGQQGLVATVQAIMLNGFGTELSTTQAQTMINEYRAAGINTGSKFLNHLSQLSGNDGATLGNRAQAAADFVDTLAAAGKSGNFSGPGVTEVVQNLMQNIGSSSASLANGTSAFNQLSAKLSSSVITGTVEGYLSGATVFGDVNRDGVLNAGEWNTTTTVNGTFLLPTAYTGEKIIVYGGTDLMTGNEFQGQISAAPGTFVSAFTTLIEAMVAGGQAGSVMEASAMLATALGLPTNINLLTYNALAVLGSTTATSAEKAVALAVQASAVQINNVITQLTAVIDNAAPGTATHASAAAAVTLAIVQILAADAAIGGTLSLVSADVNAIVAAAVTATGITATLAQQGQIASIIIGNNATAAAATSITALGQAADVAQGSATDALIAGALANNYVPAQTAFTGAALAQANYNVTVGSISPGVPAPPTASQAAVVPTPPPPVPGLNVSLTTAGDNLSGGAGDDIFTGSYGNGAGPYTFNAGDIVNGLAGTNDRIKITTGAEASTLPDGHWASVSNFEEVFLQSLGNGAQTFTSGANFLAAFGASGVELEVETLLGAIDVTMTSFTGVATITTTTIGAGAHTIVTGSGAATVTATGQSAGSQTINGVGLTTVTADISGAGNQVIGTTLGGNLVTVNATIGAAGSQTIASTSGSNVTIVAEAASGAQTVTTANGNDSVTTIGATGQLGTINTGAGNDTISAGQTTDVITGGTGVDTMTGGGGADTFQLNADGSLISSGRDIITDFNTVGADVLAFGSGTAVVLTADGTALVAGANVQTSGGGVITFHASDSTLALKIAAIQADTELDAAGSVAIFVDGGNTYVYYAGPLVANADDQLIQLSGITTLTTIIGGATMTIS